MQACSTAPELGDSFNCFLAARLLEVEAIVKPEKNGEQRLF